MTNRREDPPTAFILMPFGDEFESVYEDLIFPALSEAGFITTRADQFNTQQSVMQDIIQSIGRSALIIADLTGGNPNVYYELGIAHGLRRQVILMTQKIESLPFDLRSYRVIEYSLHLRDARRASARLRELAAGVRDGTALFGNPVSDFLDPELFSSRAPQRDEDGAMLGIVDYQERFQNCTDAITSIISNISDRTESYAGALTSGTAALEELGARPGRPTPRQIRAALVDVTEETTQYSADMSSYNLAYEKLLPDFESSLEGLIHNETLDSEERRVEFRDALNTIHETIDSLQDGIDGISAMKGVTESLPKMEQNFNRANSKLIKELHRFILNIEGTQAVARRAVALGRTRLEE